MALASKQDVGPSSDIAIIYLVQYSSKKNCSYSQNATLD